jgi:hypothetical protein
MLYSSYFAKPLESMNVSTLSYQSMYCAGSSNGSITITERFSADFLIDGKSLLQALVEAGGGHSDFMGCFVKGFPDPSQKAIEKLMLKGDPDTERGRALLYICPECGDIGCGAYSVRIKKTDSSYIWEDFAYENGYEGPHVIEGVGPFGFARDTYETALNQAAAL